MELLFYVVMLCDKINLLASFEVAYASNILRSTSLTILVIAMVEVIHFSNVVCGDQDVDNAG